MFEVLIGVAIMLIVLWPAIAADFYPEGILDDAGEIRREFRPEDTRKD